jgi:NCS1 family nucleobase:cation symporter-1
MAMADSGQMEGAKTLDAIHEFEREPVSEANLQPPRHFAGLFAGEHVAGTEFTIGGLFIALGCTTKDVLIGLLLGNLLAVLTWTFICAPIAVQTRLTLYWYLRKIAGPGTTFLYNILNAVLFCILAGCMITVSASGVAAYMGIPDQTGWIPTSGAFALIVVIIGAVVVVLAIFGFKRLAQFSAICSPWMILMFLAGGIVSLPYITSHTDTVVSIRGIADFWAVGDANIWTGRDSSGAANPNSFWQIAAFAWICNLAMHGGMSDMALFRYARTHWYGLFSAIGMFIGHYMAWITAGMMGAATMLMLQKGIGEINPGTLAYNTLGIAGVVAVIIAGWTTSNPTLYRAGLAFQAVTPNWPRWKVTLVAGIATVIISISPKVFTGLLNFVGLYGLLLAPVGAIVFTEHWIFPRIGYTRYWASYKKLAFSWPAVATWLIVIGFALVVQQDGYLPFGLNLIHLFFLFLPVFILSIALYTILAGLAGAKEKYPQAAEAERVESKRQADEKQAVAKREAPPTMKLRMARAISMLMLAICVIWPIMVYCAGDDFGGTAFMAAWETLKAWLIVPSLVYFVTATIWAIERDHLREKA